jgi:glycosyltransferase involved in cell wall biosynthesis
MRTLVANIPLPQNRFLVDLNAALGRHVQLVHDHKIFWNMEGDFDIVHLHFPEYITYEIESAYRESLSDALMAQLEERLQHWSANSTLVITRHVLLPHDARSDPRWEKLYEMVYRYVAGVVHFAEPSVTEFKQRYANTEFVHGQPRHCIVPHHNYASLPNTVGQVEARKALGIPKKSNVMLVFGAIRNDAERDLIEKSFSRLRTRKKLLLVSRWRENLANVSWIRLKYWLRDLNRLYYRLHPRYHFNYGFVEEEDTQLYLNAADVLFIPRLHVLNSGNITLGMTFGKVVVGPDSLDVGHLLKTTGNMVFDPDRPETAAHAIERGMELAGQNEIGPANQQLALSEWSADQCADRYFEFFSELIRARESS